MAGPRGLYFACDDNPLNLEQLKHCATSIRQVGCTLPVYAVIIGEVDSTLRDHLQQTGVNYRRRRWSDYPAFVRQQPTFLKWYALPDFAEYDELLFLDTDTFCYRDPNHLFDEFGSEDVHARCSYQGLETDRLIGKSLMLIHPPGALPQYIRRYRTLQEQLGAKPVFGMNTGVLVFKNGSHRRIGDRLDLFTSLRTMFHRGLLPYPITPYVHLIDEVVARLALGLMDGITCREIPDKLVPFYMETYQVLGAAPAVLVHTFRGMYAHFLLTQFGPEMCQHYLSMRKHDHRSLSTRTLSLLRLLGFCGMHFSGLTRVGLSYRCAMARKRLAPLITHTTEE